MRAGSVLVIGAGGLGCPALLYLAAAGVGRIGIVDPDRVDRTNLQRQVLYDHADVGGLKTDAAYRRLKALDPAVRVETWPVRFTAATAAEMLPGFDVVLDGTDNFASRYQIQAACRLAGLPLVHGSVLRFAGQATTLLPDGPCYRCLFPQPPADVPSCAEAGVLGVLPGLIGTVMATESIKLLTGAGRTLAGRLLLLDALDLRFRELSYARDPDCPGCGPAAGREAAAVHFPNCTVPTEGTAMHTIDVTTLDRRRKAGENLLLVDVRESHELDICRIPGSVHIPMGQVPARLAEIPKDRPVVLQCHHGGRSGRVAEFLLANGYDNVLNLTGGIHAWAEQVEPGMARY